MSSYGRIKGARAAILPSRVMPVVYVAVTPAINVWVTVLPLTSNVELVSFGTDMETAAENLEVRVTIDGNVYLGAQAAAVAGTYYFWYRTRGGALVLANHDYGTMIDEGCHINARSVMVEMRKTTANGANELRGIVHYSRW